MSAAVPIYQGQDFYVPAFELKIADRPPGRDVIRDILSVTYKDSLEEIDSFDITINNWDAETRDFKYSDEHLFDPGQKVELAIGYQNALRPMLSGEITSLRPSFPAGGGSTLAVSGLNVLHRLRKGQVSRAYVNKTDSQIAQQIGQALNVDIRPARSPDEPTFVYVLQDNKYDIVFLMERARRNGYDLIVREQAGKTTIEYQASTTVHQATYRLTYGKSLIEFQPELTTANQVGQVTVRGWDVLKKKPIEYTAKRSELKSRGLNEKSGLAQVEKAVEDRSETVTRPVESEAEAKQLAREILQGIAKEMVKGNGSVPGLPDLRAGTVLEIDGLGQRFSGRYFVTATTHTIGDSGYTTQFECRREEL